MPAPIITLRGDLTGVDLGVAPTWTDYTAFLETGADGQPIDITWGRQDKNSEVQPTTFSFVLNNTDGRFTVGSAIVNPGDQFNVRVTHNAITYDRATGYVESVDITWPGQVGSFQTVRVNCVDITGVVARAGKLRSFLEHDILIQKTDGPQYFWPCTERTTNRARVGELVGEEGDRPSARLVTTKFGANNYGLGGQPVVEDEAFSFFTECTGEVGDFKAAGLQFPRGLFGNAGTFAVEMMFAATSGGSGGGGAQTLLNISRGPEANDFVAQIQIVPSNGSITWYIQRDQDTSGTGNNAGTGVNPSKNYLDGEYHHIVVGRRNDGITPFMYLDGVEQTNVNIIHSPLPTTKIATATPYVGIPNTALGTGGGFSYSFGLNGRVGMVAFYKTLPLFGTIQDHYQAALGHFGESSTARFARVAALAGLPVGALPAGLATMGAQELSGRRPVDALRDVARTEGGQMLVTGAGALTFQARNARYNPVSAFTVAATELNPDLAFRRDRDGLINDQTYEGYRGGQQRFIDQPSIDRNGPQEGANLVIAPSTDDDAYQHAAWDVVTGKDPKVRISEVTFDLITQPNTALVASLLAATVSTAFTITGLPTQTPGGSTRQLFIEGGQESIGAGVWSMELFTSPTSVIPATLVALGSPGVLSKLDTGLKVAY